MTFLLVALAGVWIGVLLLVVSLCHAARRGDRMVNHARLAELGEVTPPIEAISRRAGTL